MINYRLPLPRAVVKWLCPSIIILFGLQIAKSRADHIALLLWQRLQHVAVGRGASQDALLAYLARGIHDVIHSGQVGLLAVWGGAIILNLERLRRNQQERFNPVAGSERWISAGLLALVVLTLAYTPFIISDTPTFEAGDGGVKYLQVKHILKGVDTSQFDVDSADWVKNLWTRLDSFPIEAPFVYCDEQLGVRYMTHPLPFVYFSAFLFDIFGLAGLRLLPALATCMAMVLVWLGCGRSIRSMIWALLMVCATPLLYFTMTFWEHAVVIPFVMAAFLLIDRSRSYPALLLCGLLLGLPVLFRSECMVLYIAGFVLIIGHPWRGVVFFASGLFASGCLYLFLNMSFYGSLVPPHASEVAGRSLFLQASQGVLNLAAMSSSLLSLCPLLCFSVLGLRQAGLDRRIVLMSLLAAVLVVFIVPNTGCDDFGPRFWLFIVPSLFLVSIRSAWSCVSPVNRVITFSMLLYSMIITIQTAARQLPQIRLERTWPVINFSETLDVDAVLVGHQFIAQEMAVAMTKDRPFFRITAQNETGLLDELSRRSVASVMVVTYPDDRWGGCVFSSHVEHIPYQIIRSYRINSYIVNYCRLKNRSEK